MKRIIFSIIVLISISSCKKEIFIKEGNLLLGTWFSNSPTLQFTIENLKGQGKYYNFIEYSEKGNSFLKIKYSVESNTPPTAEDNYLIKSLSKKQLVLIDMKDSLKTEIKLIRL